MAELQRLAKVDDYIKRDEPFPDNVAAIIDADGDFAVRRADESWACYDGEQGEDDETPRYGVRTISQVRSWAIWPVRVSKVREPEPDPAPSGLCEVGADRVTCIVMAADHRRTYHGGRPVPPYASTEALLQAAEPQPESDLLAKVREYGDDMVRYGESGEQRYAESASLQLDRIEAEVQRLRDLLGAAERQRDEHHAEVGRLTGERDELRDAIHAETTVEALEGIRQLREQIGMTQADRLRAETRVGDLLAEVERLKAAAPQQDGPTVLKLQQAPEGAVALVGSKGGKRYVRSPAGGAWMDEQTAQVMPLWRVLEREDSVTVEMAPREPRTFPRLDAVPDDLRHVRGASGTVYARSSGTFAFNGYRDGQSVTRSLHALQEEDGPLTEVLDGGEAR